MLVEFSVANYRSIRDTLVLSMETAAIKAKDPAVDEKNLILLPGTKTKQLLKLKALFGGNASGKSNVVKALNAMLWLMDASFENQYILPKLIEPFRLDQESRDKPTFFEIIILWNEKQYRYGFEANNDIIVTEWLFGPATNRETYYFIREGQDIEVNRERFREGMRLIQGDTSSLLRPNALAFSLLHTLNQPISSALFAIIRKFTVVSYDNYVNEFVNHQEIKKFFYNLEKFIIDDENKKALIELLRVADIAIADLYQEPGKEFKFKLKKRIPKTENYEDFNLFDESQGTQKMLYLLVNFLPILKDPNGGVLVVDELDAKLHPNLTAKIIQLFQNQATNPHRVQLIFVTHDTNLMSLAWFRRDQIELLRRDFSGVTTQTPLVNYRLRNDKAIREDYLEGLYRGVPWLNQFEDAAKYFIHGQAN